MCPFHSESSAQPAHPGTPLPPYASVPLPAGPRPIRPPEPLPVRSPRLRSVPLQTRPPDPPARTARPARPARPPPGLRPPARPTERVFRTRKNNPITVPFFPSGVEFNAGGRGSEPFRRTRNLFISRFLLTGICQSNPFSGDLSCMILELSGIRLLVRCIVLCLIFDFWYGSNSAVRRLGESIREHER